MSNWLSGAIGAGGDLAGAAWGASQARDESRRNRQFQERMSNTAYQRAAKDLEKAGLNRILALGSPASTPSGAQASFNAPKLGATGIAAASARQAIEQSKAQIRLTDAQARVANAEAGKVETTKMLWERLGPELESILDSIFSSSAKDARGSLSDKVLDRLQSEGSSVRDQPDTGGTWSKAGSKKSAPSAPKNVDKPAESYWKKLYRKSQEWIRSKRK